MARRIRIRFSSALLVTVLLAAACGDDGGNAALDDPTTTTEAPSENEGSTTTAPEADATTTTDAPTTTTSEPPPAGPEPMPIEDIPALVMAWGAGTDDPLELAQDIIGFPLAIPTPGNTTPLHLSVDMFGGDPESRWVWDWTYEVLTSDPMPEIAIGDEPSPGTEALSDFYDPLMADLGRGRVGTTGSDPGNGTQSVNHVYDGDGEPVIVNGLEATPKPVFVWADEDQVFGEGVPGYRVDVPFEFGPNVIPVPLIQTILDEFPEVSGAQLVDVEIRTWNRPESSFDAEWGLRYLTIAIEWALPPGIAEEVKTTIAAHDSTAIVAGAASFFDPGFFEPEEPREFGDEWTQSVVFVDRYPGQVTVGGDDAAGATLELELELEPNREVLQELPD